MSNKNKSNGLKNNNNTPFSKDPLKKEPSPIVSPLTSALSEADVSISSVPSAMDTPSAKKAPEKTIISPGTVIDGIIRTEGSVDNLGIVNGEIIAQGSILLFGTHVGNLKGGEVILSHARVNGNISADGKVLVDQETQITGDIQADSIMLDGQITGNICAENLITLKSGAKLSGNVSTNRIAVTEGAFITGKIQMGTPAPPAEKDKSDQ